MKTALLDTSFLIDLAEETAGDTEGPARRTLERPAGYRLFISPATVAEFIEGADDPVAAERVLGGFRCQTLGWAAARRCAVSQSRAARRMGENDAWQVALALLSGHRLVGHDAAFAGRGGIDYLDHRRS